MFKSVISYTYSDRPFNEDTYAYDTNYMLVIDGATGLAKNDHMHVGDDAMWFVNKVKDEIVKHINDSLSLSEIVRNAVFECQKEYPTNVERIDMPSGCIALFRLKEDQLEYFGLGDTIGVIETDNGIEIFIDEVLETLDGNVKKQMLELSKMNNISFLETRKFDEVKEHLIKNRNMRNREGGYYSLDITAEGIEHAMIKTWNIKDVKRIACMSDGFAEILEYGIYDSMKDVLDKIEENHEMIEKQLFDIQQQDEDCKLVPRFKLRDDTTYIFTKLR